jgi:glucose-6-phosphate 1-dehydrogenase
MKIMSSQIIPVDPFDYIVFGGTGDLAERKLLPALYHRQAAGQFSEPTRIIGASRSEKSQEEYQAFAMAALKEHVKPKEFDQAEADKFVQRLDYVALDAKSDKGWEILVEKLKGSEDRVRAFYMAVGPSLFGDISENIRQHGLITDKTRVVVEKPLGRDLASARELNDTRTSFPHRSLFGQGNSAKPHGFALRQCAL